MITSIVFFDKCSVTEHVSRAPQQAAISPPNRHTVQTSAASVQTFLSGPSPYSGPNPPRSWLPQAKKTREFGVQAAITVGKKPVLMEEALAKPTTCDVGVQSFIPALKPSRLSKPTSALALKEEARAIVVQTEAVAAKETKTAAQAEAIDTPVTEDACEQIFDGLTCRAIERLCKHH